MLKAIVDSLDSVPEALRGEYMRKDGKFFLQVEAIDGYALEDVTGLRKVLDEVKAERGKLRKDFDAVDGEAGSLKRKIAELEASQDAKAADKVEKLKADLQELHKQEIEKVTSERDGLLKSFEHSELTQKATQALVAKGFTENGIKLLIKTEIPSQAKLVKTDSGYNVAIFNEKGLERSGKNGGSMMLEELADELVTAYPELVRSTTTPGMGAPGSADSGSASGKTMAIKEYTDLEPMQQHEFMKAGGKVVDV